MVSGFGVGVYMSILLSGSSSFQTIRGATENNIYPQQKVADFDYPQKSSTFGLDKLRHEVINDHHHLGVSAPNSSLFSPGIPWMNYHKNLMGLVLISLKSTDPSS